MVSNVRMIYISYTQKLLPEWFRCMASGIQWGHESGHNCLSGPSRGIQNPPDVARVDLHRH